MKYPFTTIALLAGLSLSGVAQAALHDRGNGLIYDDVLNVTWLADASLAGSQSFGVSNITQMSGGMSWYVAQTWLAAMNSANYLGYSDWRLPTVKPVNGVAFNDQFSTDGTTDFGYNITRVNSEMAHLANVDLRDINPTCYQENTPNCHLFNIGLFKNVWQNHAYITGTNIYPGSDDILAFVFDHPVTVNSVPYNYGYQGIMGMGDEGVVMVLRDGDVAAVPEPETYAMMFTGLGLVGAAVRRRRDKRG